MIEVALNILVCLGILYGIIETAILFREIKRDQIRHKLAMEYLIREHQEEE